MREYRINCGHYTDTCFKVVLGVVELVQGIYITDIDTILQEITFVTPNPKTAKKLQRMLSMGDIGELYEVEK